MFMLQLVKKKTIDCVKWSQFDDFVNVYYLRRTQSVQCLQIIVSGLLPICRSLKMYEIKKK